MASSATVSAPKKRKSFSEYFHSMRGQQLVAVCIQAQGGSGHLAGDLFTF